MPQALAPVGAARPARTAENGSPHRGSGFAGLGKAVRLRPVESGVDMCWDGRNSADAARVGAVHGGFFVSDGLVRREGAKGLGRGVMDKVRLLAAVPLTHPTPARHKRITGLPLAGRGRAQIIKLRCMIHNGIDKGNEFINTGFILPCVL